jgi:UDP-N-acetylmuramoylalanine--D-glutamate ligase
METLFCPHQDSIDQVEREDEGCWHVVELSSFQLEGVDRFRPRVSVMLNLTADHMDRHGSLERYGAAKERIFRNQGADDAAVLNADDAVVAAMARRIRAKILWFSSRGPVPEGAFVTKGRIVFRKDGSEAEVMPLSDIPLRGRHNVENVLACTAAAMTAGVAPDEIAAAVRNFRAVEHRLEHVDTIGGVAFFNDSKATNVDAALKALQSFREPLVLILGGRDKGSDFSPLRQEIAERARHVIVLGEAAGKIEQALAPALSVLRATSLEEAVQKGFSLAAPGDVVLLAPACASFDMFRDYQDRGENFKAAVRRLRKAGE